MNVMAFVCLNFVLSGFNHHLLKFVHKVQEVGKVRRLAKSRRSRRLGGLRGLEIGFGGPLGPGRFRKGGDLGKARDIGAL